MNSWLRTLRDALDFVEHGVILVDGSLTVRFINRAYYKMWGLREAAAGETYKFEALERHAAGLGVVQISANDLPAYYVRNRMALLKPGSQAPIHLRLRDGRIFRVESCMFPGGGHMFSYTDETVVISSIRQMQALATTDELTHAFNRRHFYSTGQTELERARRYKHPLSVVLLHPDDFKHIKDVYGHAAADQVLVSIAACLRDSVRESDYVGRLRGEEFAVTLIEAPHHAAFRVAEKLCKRIGATPVQTQQGEIVVSASFGVASLTEGIAEFSELLRKADEAFGPDHGTREAPETGVTPERRSFEPSPLHQYRRSK
jgi:diguanylate cyclase (GGDEF)-like protein